MQRISTSKSDQPTVLAKDLKRLDATDSMQYKVLGIKSYNQRSPSARQPRR